MTQTKTGTAAVIFDLGRVLFDFDWGIAMQRLRGRIRPDPQDFYHLLAEHPDNIALEDGTLTAAEFFKRWLDFAGFNGSVAEFIEIWCNIFQPIEKNLQLLQECVHRPDLQTAFLSNTNPAHIEWLRPRTPIFDQVDHVFLSFEQGLRKPDPAFYQRLLKTMQLGAGQCVFIDDLAANCQAARKLGIRSIQYTGQDLSLEQILY
ncbi:MAG: HAD family phosphatase [Leptospiraceae bacterium]|nr:HAD family phosphatase [Leptospiraceae bacterium]